MMVPESPADLPVAAPDHAETVYEYVHGVTGDREAARLAALDALKRADGELKSIIIRCEEGDPKTDWLPTIARLARSARAALAVEEDAPHG